MSNFIQEDIEYSGSSFKTVAMACTLRPVI